jgi:S-ribosylhomocysteine lyase LuxS involved in autoinducer biosynthesis
MSSPLCAQFVIDTIPEVSIVGRNDLKHFCILARIVGDNEPMYNEQASNITHVLASNIRNNNNISMRNVSQLDFSTMDGILNNSNSISVGNSLAVSKILSIKVYPSFGANSDSLIHEAELRLHLDDLVWNKWLAGGKVSTGLKIIDSVNKTLILDQPNAELKNLLFQPEELGSISFSVNFLTKDARAQDVYNYSIVQSDNNDSLINGYNFQIIKPGREDMFNAEIETIDTAMSGALLVKANAIAEPAIYNWYTKDRVLISSGEILNIPNNTFDSLLLQVTADADAYRDYYWINTSLFVSQPSLGSIVALVPNPASNQVSVQYNISNYITVR